MEPAEDALREATNEPVQQSNPSVSPLGKGRRERGGRSTTGSLAVATAIAFTACTASPAPQQPPKIVFHETTHDFGHADQGTRVTHIYTFRNGGGLDLTIDNVRTSCGCTAALTSARVIAPGGDGTIEASFDTVHYAGRKTQTVTVYSNDPAQPAATLTLFGTIAADVAAEPPALYVGHVRRGQAAPNEVRLVVAEGVGVGPIEATGSVVDAELHDAASGAAGKRVHVAVKKDAPVGRFKESVRMHTTSARRPLLTIAVIGIVDDDAPSSAAGGN